VRTAGVFWRGDASDLRTLDGPDERQRAKLIAGMMKRWKALAKA
jgi:hypothetical protein